MSKLTQKIGKEIKFSSKLNHHESVYKGGGLYFKVSKVTLKMLKYLESELSPFGFINDKFTSGGGYSTNYTYGVTNPKNGLSIWVWDFEGDEDYTPVYQWTIGFNKDGEDNKSEVIKDIDNFIKGLK
jgi:hypothetical protein